MKPKCLVVAQREQSSMTSSWNEYLCLSTMADGTYELFTGRYSPLAERSEFYNEETEEYEVPDEIEGKTVVGFEDDYVVGGDLDYYDETEAVTFSDVADPVVTAWLTESGWMGELEALDLEEKIRQISL